MSQENLGTLALRKKRRGSNYDGGEYGRLGLVLLKITVEGVDNRSAIPEMPNVFCQIKLYDN